MTFELTLFIFIFCQGSSPVKVLDTDTVQAYHVLDCSFGVPKAACHLQLTNFAVERSAPTPYIYLSVCLCNHLSVCLTICLSVYLSLAALSLSLSLSLSRARARAFSLYIYR